MSRRGVLAGLLPALAAVAFVALPADALAKHKHKAPKPAVGTWTTTGGGGPSGSFSVASGDGSVSNIQVPIGSQAAIYCGTGTATVAGSEPMHVVKGGLGNKSEYIVGTGDKVAPHSAYVIQGVTVNVTVDANTFAGQLEIAFRSAKVARYQGDGGIFILEYTNPAYPGTAACEFDERLVPPAA